MDQRTANNMVRAFAPRLQDDYHVEPFVPLEIKLWLERLRLREMLDEMRRRGAMAERDFRNLCEMA
jgi:hypothetical protein